jgi:hypothetical protein
LAEDGQGESSLSIRRVKVSDEGLYRVIASNRYGRSKSSAFLRVEKTQERTESRSTRSVQRGLPPISGSVARRTAYKSVTEIQEISSIQTNGYEQVTKRTISTSQSTTSDEIEVLEKPSRNIDVTEGECLELTFRIKCNAYYRANWTKRGRTLNYDQRHRIMRDTSTGLHQLSIDRCAPMDSGKYTLEIESDSLKENGGEGRLVLAVHVDVSPKPFERRRSSASSREGPFTSARLSLSRSTTPAKQA